MRLSTTQWIILGCGALFVIGILCVCGFIVAGIVTPTPEIPAGLRCASPHGGASKPPASPPLGGASHLAPIRCLPNCVVSFEMCLARLKGVP